MSKPVFSPDILEKIYPGCLDPNERPVLDRSMPLIDFRVKALPKPRHPVFSPLEKVISERGLHNQLGIAYKGVKNRNGEQDKALDEAGKNLTAVASFIAHAGLSLRSLGMIYDQKTGLWDGASVIKTSYATPVLAELLLADESYNIDSYYPDGSRDKGIRLVEMFEALSEMEEKRIHDLCKHCLAVHRTRRTIWRDELEGVKPHPVVYSLIQRERKKRTVSKLT